MVMDPLHLSFSSSSWTCDTDHTLASSRSSCPRVVAGDTLSILPVGEMTPTLKRTSRSGLLGYPARVCRFVHLKSLRCGARVSSSCLHQCSAISPLPWVHNLCLLFLINRVHQNLNSTPFVLSRCQIIMHLQFQPPD
jgi:hypothetical protein